MLLSQSYSTGRAQPDWAVVSIWPGTLSFTLARYYSRQRVTFR